MDTRLVTFVLATLLVQTLAQTEGETPPLKVEFLNRNERHVNLGDEVDLTFVLNRNFMFPLTNKVELVREQMVDGKKVHAVLAESAKLMDGEPEFYSANINPDATATDLTIHFKILQVRDIDDATFICKAEVEGTNGEFKTDTVKVVVLRPSKKLELTFNNLKPFHESMTTPFQVDAGEYPVRCSVEGSNPATKNLQIYWSGEEVQTSELTVEEIPGAIRGFKSTVEGTFKLEIGKAGQDIECVAVSPAGDMLKTKAPINVNVYDPVVECTEANAYVGQRYPVLSCTVDESGLDITQYGYQFGETGDTVYVGEQNTDYDEVQKTNLGDSKVKVDLKLHKAKESHFTKYYLVINHSNGHTTREAVVLNKVEGNGNSGGSGEGPKDASAMLRVSALTLVLCAVYALWNSL